MICLKCCQKIDRNSSEKISCSDCMSIFHFACIKVKAQDIVNSKSLGKSFRCKKCIAKSKTLTVSECVTVADATSLTNNNNPTFIDNSKSSMMTEKEAGNGKSDSECTIQMVYAKLTKLEDKFDCYLKSLNELHTENVELKSKIEVLESKLNWQQQHHLKKCIEIVGVPNVNNNNAQTKAQHIFSKCLSLEISNDKIDKCYVKRVHSKKEINGDNSSQGKSIICIKFSDVKTKQRIMSVKTKNNHKLFSLNLNNDDDDGDVHTGGGGGGDSGGDGSGSGSGSGRGKGNAVYINDALTNFTQALFMQAKEAKKKQGFKYLWFKSNQILMRKDEGGKVISIKSFSDLAII